MYTIGGRDYPEDTADAFELHEEWDRLAAMTDDEAIAEELAIDAETADLFREAGKHPGLATSRAWMAKVDRLSEHWWDLFEARFDARKVTREYGIKLAAARRKVRKDCEEILLEAGAR